MKESGAEVIRSKNHIVYKLPSGKKLVIPKTPGDPRRQDLNNCAALRRLMDD